MAPLVDQPGPQPRGVRSRPPGGRGVVGGGGGGEGELVSTIVKALSLKRH